jgi:DNA-binding MarR family transcriptional regulator
MAMAGRSIWPLACADNAIPLPIAAGHGGSVAMAQPGNRSAIGNRATPRKIDDYALSRMKVAASPLFLREAEVARGVALLMIGQAQLFQAVDGHLRNVGIGRAHFRLLSHIARWPGATMGDLTVITGTSKQALSRVTRDLIARGLIVHRTDLVDKRRKHIDLTEAGRRVETDATAALIAAMIDAYGAAGQQAVTGFWHVLEGLIPVATRMHMADLDRGG